MPKELISGTTEPMRSIQTKWPESDLEYIGKCPLCASPQRQVLFDDLEDFSFRVAPGIWTMWRCDACSSTYLDPRPNQISIGRAYERYYTHTDPAGDGRRIPFRQSLRVIKSRMQKGYWGAKYRLEMSSMDRIGGFVFGLFPKMALAADLRMRGLLRPSTGHQRLLDVGCGSGAFLKDAISLGYDAIGMDPDEKARLVGREAGLDIRCGGLPATGFPDDHFSYVTLSHVFEHLHRPLEAIAELCRILEPGGQIWMAMPNSDAVGLKMFGKYWRGLEAPRHLTLPNPSILEKLLRDAGFCDVRHPKHPPSGTFFVEKSLAQKAGYDPYDESGLRAIRGAHATKLVREIDRIGKANPAQTEVLIVMATKPRKTAACKAA